MNTTVRSGTTTPPAAPAPRSHTDAPDAPTNRTPPATHAPHPPANDRPTTRPLGSPEPRTRPREHDASHQPHEYNTSRQTPSRRTPTSPLKLEVTYCVGVSSSMQSTIAFSGGFRYRPTTSTSFSSKRGSFESLNVSTRCGLTPRRPDPLHRRRAHARAPWPSTGNSNASPPPASRATSSARSPRPSPADRRLATPPRAHPRERLQPLLREPLAATPSPSSARHPASPRSACSQTRRRPSTAPAPAEHHDARAVCEPTASPAPPAARR